MTGREAVVEALERNVGTIIRNIVTQIPRASLDHGFVGWLADAERAVEHGLKYAVNDILDALPAEPPRVTGDEIHELIDDVMRDGLGEPAADDKVAEFLRSKGVAVDYGEVL